MSTTRCRLANAAVRSLALLVVSCFVLVIVPICGEPLKKGVTKNVPRPFTDYLLAEAQRFGTLVPDLGRVQLLDTFMAPKAIEEIKPVFAIFNNWRKPQRHRITPDAWATLGMADYDKYGPYHFDLDYMLESGFDASKRTVVMIPGYFSPEEASWVSEARARWLELDRDVNVIDVSWADSNSCTYSRAVAHTVLVARQVTIFLHYLAELSGTHLQDGKFLERIHIIGHSLGAHIAGFVGQDLNGRLGRITGLDPAGPTFDKFLKHQRLDRDDARLVEVLHTNGGQMKYLNFLASAPLHALSSLAFVNDLKSKKTAGDTAWFGIEQQIGHVDYYANNGRLQAGCSDVLHICDHKRARDIYVDLLNYECSLRRSQSTASLVSLLESNNDKHNLQLNKMNRLYAFKAPDYETFASGGNFIMSCPELMTITKHLDDEQVLKSFKNCSIPLLDFMKPVNELIEELKQVHDINFVREDEFRTASAAAASNESALANIVKPTENSPYYFKTSSDTGHLVGDHYLLKIYLLEKPIWDPSNCALETQIVLNDGEIINLELERVVHPTANQRVLAMPFVHLDTSRAKDQFNNLMKLIKMVELEREQQMDQVASANVSSQYEPSQEFVQVFQELFPRTITLSLGKPKASGVFRTMKDMTIKMIKRNDEAPVCKLTIDMVEVHPLVYGLKRNFGALYGRNLFLGAYDEKLAVFTAADQLKQLDHPDRFITTLAHDSISSFGVGLEAALVG